MRNLATIKTANLLSMFILLFSALAFVSGCKNKENKKSQITISKDSLKTNNYVQIATGQYTLYDNDGNVLDAISESDSLYGQDANYLKGEKMSFTKNGNGTITDNNSGLMWQEIPTSEGFNWQDAKEYCENLELGGYDDWRMPSAKELFSISNFNSGWPYLDTNYFSLVNNEEVDKSEQYWSSNTYVGHTEEGGYNAAFGVNHATGHIKAYPAAAPDKEKDHKGPPPNRQPPPGQGEPPENGRPPQNGERPTGNPLLKHVRAVRGTVYGINNFTDNKDGTISDNATGLMWPKGDSGKGLNWKDALVYAKNANIADYTDWRLPNVKELQGIVDYSFAPNAKDSKNKGPAIDPIFNCTPISNEAGTDDFGYYWTSTSAHFRSGEPYFYAWYVAFGMAVNNEGKDFHGAGAVRFDTKYEGGNLGEGGERTYNYVRLVRNIN